MGHGHVIPNNDGSKARCGGPAICLECAAELAESKPDNNVHVMPKDSAHYETDKCWCTPELMEDYTSTGGVKVYLHKQIQ